MLNTTSEHHISFAQTVRATSSRVPNCVETSFLSLFFAVSVRGWPLPKKSWRSCSTLRSSFKTSRVCSPPAPPLSLSLYTYRHTYIYYIYIYTCVYMYSICQYDSFFRHTPSVPYLRPRATMSFWRKKKKKKFLK